MSAEKAPSKTIPKRAHTAARCAWRTAYYKEALAALTIVEILSALT